MTCTRYEGDDRELLKGAKIDEYIDKRWEVYVCFEKDGKHYVLLVSAEIDIGNSITAMVFGPDCERVETVESEHSAVSDIPDVARWCWGEKKV